jgi:hypothetical protein
LKALKIIKKKMEGYEQSIQIGRIGNYKEGLEPQVLILLGKQEIHPIPPLLPILPPIPLGKRCVSS